MSFTSFEFIIFLAAVVVLYYLLPRKVQWLLLLAASLIFYMAGGAKTVLYLLFTTLSTYLAGRMLGQLNDKRAALSAEEKKMGLSRIKKRKQLTVLLVTLANFGLLYVLKYWNFTASALQNISGGALVLPTLDLLMPIGISFYMFQSIGYVVDCYRGKYPPEKNVLKYALFTSFFPQVVQGPISRFNEVGHQLSSPHPFDADNLKYGLQLVMYGYIKKLIIADRAAIVVNTVFDAPDNYSGAVIAFAVFFYCIQLYCDFSGGIDITRGVAQMLGIHLSENFRRPIFATSLADYWRRWHITLGQWMKDYVFYPLSLSKPFSKLIRFSRKHIKGKAGKVLPTALATFVVYFIIGIWHGANFRYIFFGFWNGTIITCSVLLATPYYELRQKLKISDNNKFLHAFRLIRTWFLVFLGRYITRAPRLLTAFSMIWATFTRFNVSSLFDGTLLELGLPAGDMCIVAVGMLIIIIIEFFQERGVHIRLWLEKRPAFVQWLGIALPLIALLLLGIMRGSYISSEFIYKQF